MSSYILLLAGFVCLVAAEVLHPVMSMAYLAAAFASWFYRFEFTRKRQLLIFLTLIFISGVDLVFFSDLVQASVHVMLLISLVKLFAERTASDYLLLYAVSFTFLLVASAYTVSLLFLVSLIVYSFCAVVTFILYENRKAYLESRTARFSLAACIHSAGLITLLILLVSVPIFLAVPRTALGLFRVRDNNQINLSGFSDRVNLGDIGHIMSDRRVFMRVQLQSQKNGAWRRLLPEEIPADLKWRGVALDHYDGRAWTNTGTRYRYIAREPRTGSFPITPTLGPQETALRQEVTPEVPTRVVFGANRIAQVSGVRATQIRLDGNDSLQIVTRRRRDVPRYTVDSGFISRGQRLSMARTDSPHSEELSRYLQLPRLDPRIRQLADRQSASQQSAIGKALVLESFLKSKYGYSLDNQSAPAPDPLSDFLFRGRTGHCEYFATALAVMLRTQNIPSRIVNGFQLGEYNPWNDRFVVRHSNAHSWVEAFIPGAGWIEFDATPSGPVDTRSLMTRLASQMLDAVDVFWAEVINFDLRKQIGFFSSVARSIRAAVDDTTAKFRKVEASLFQWWTGIKNLEGWTIIQTVSVAGLICVTLIIWRKRRILYLWTQRIGWRSRQQAPPFYLDLLDVLRKRGLERRPAETPGEFLSRVESRLDSTVPARITQSYYRSRFGGELLTNRELVEINGWLRELSARGSNAPSVTR